MSTEVKTFLYSLDTVATAKWAGVVSEMKVPLIKIKINTQELIITAALLVNKILQTVLEKPR